MTLAETLAFLQREEERKDLLAVMGTAEGRRFLWRMLGAAGVFRSSFIVGSPDSTAFNEGARSFGLSLLGDIMTDAPEQYLIMQKEAMDNDQKKSNERSSNDHGAQADGDPGGGNPHD